MPSSSLTASPQGADVTQSATTDIGGPVLSATTSSTTSPTTSTTTPATSAGTISATLSSTKTANFSSITTSPVLPTIPVASSSSTITPGAHAPSSGVPTGAAAGIGVGCAVVGALFALMLSYLFFKKGEARQSRRRSSRMEKSNPGFLPDKESAVVITQGQNIDSDLDRLLPQEADDSTVRKKASTLFDQVELHVENYYRDVKVSITPAMERELSRFSSPHLSEPLVAFLNSTSRPRQLIKHSLAFHVISLTLATGESSRSLVPPEIVEMVKTVNRRKPTPDSGLAFSRWRMLTTYLRPDLVADTRTTNTQPDPALNDAVQSFTRVFAPWAKPDVPDAEKIKNLSDIVEEAVRFAMWLFSQPSSFKYDWKPAVDVRDRANRSVVTVPAVLKVTDNRGQALVRPVGVVGASRTRV